MPDKTKISDSKALQLPVGKDELPVIAAGLIHEVKNPLAAIHLHLQLLESYSSEIENTELRDKIRNKVGVIQREILGLNSTLQEFINFIRSDYRKKNAAFSIGTLVQDIIQLLEVQAEREKIHIEFIPLETELSSSTDPVFLKQILINLILNSLQALSSYDKKTAEKRIRISIGKVKDEVFLSVEDNGPGISFEDQEKIFDPFYTTKKEGSGLGLALVKKMTGEMGGRVELESKPEKGTRVTVFFGLPDEGKSSGVKS